MSETYFDKLWKQHVIRYYDERTALLQIDRLFIHELSGAVSLRNLEKSGRTVARPAQVFGVVDHLVSTRPGRGADEPGARGGADMIRDTRDLSAHYGLTFFDTLDPRQGIVHVVSPERGIALPGTTLVCGDSHTCTVGGIGALAWGIGTTEIEHVLATQTLRQDRPKNMRVVFHGNLGRGTGAKDMILRLISEVGVGAGIGHAAEFAGPAVRSLPIEARLTLCNMAVEFQAKYGFVPADDTTFDYLHGRDYAPKGRAWDQAVAHWRQLSTDEGASFDKEVSIDCTDLRPQVTWGTDPSQAIAIDDRVPEPATMPTASRQKAATRALEYIRLRPGDSIAGTKIDAAYIGSCTNSRISDLREAASILRGRKVSGSLRAICVPGSTSVKRQAEAEGLDKIFIEAGFEWHESGCAMCAAGGGPALADMRVISTTNRNFEGRQGKATRTHLASPITVAASALNGHISDPRPFLVKEYA
ncbi:3-isopropylmalate dehydratase large subunit [Salipiger profundus]|uniref:3-isopropylmalate dehydratase large subunit n=1 Tax=Salipiger profundus TaxID=1229727 RepID=UPI0008E3951A|nr:3-isopropylmalate dehydratase large subunit [Salipiger profundus]SFD80723.1 3-isopropylmalate dehydratase, large subunit [Salipiger profundus]